MYVGPGTASVLLPIMVLLLISAVVFAARSTNAFPRVGMPVDALEAVAIAPTAAGEIDDLPAQLPSTLNFGAAYTRQFAGDVSVTGLANFRSNSYDLDQYSGGLELGYADLVYARGGFNLTAENDQDFWQGWNIGAGLNLQLESTSLRVDYAYRPAEVFGDVNMFSVAVGL